jgi:hypothetical protein
MSQTVKPGSSGKSFEIPKMLIWEAYQKVKANKGAAGVDEQSLTEFAVNEKRNLYKIWNRMSSGSYFPPPVKAVEIPKAGGRGVRVLGVPTVADRPDSGSHDAGASGGTGVPPRLLRLPAGQVRVGCRGHVPATVLGTSLGCRFGYPVVL